MSRSNDISTLLDKDGYLPEDIAMKPAENAAALELDENGYIPEHVAMGTDPKRTVLGTAKDIGISALKGAIGIGEAVQGLANIPAGGSVGKFTEELGYRPKEAKEILDTYLSPAQKAANKKLQQADGFFETVQAAVENPSTILHAGVESLPLMGAGGVVGRGLVAAAPKVAPWVAGAVGEGVIGAGSAAEQIRQESNNGLMTPGQSAMALASGLGTGAFNLVGGRIAQKLGFADPDTLLVQGLGKAAKEGEEAASKGVIRRIIEGGISEGVFEELPQSVQEQIWQNAALERPLMEGVGNASAMGMLTGAAMGAGANVLPQAKPTSPPPTVDTTPDGKPKGPLSKAADMLIGGAGQPGLFGTAPAMAPPPTDDPRMAEEWGDQSTEALAYNHGRNTMLAKPGDVKTRDALTTPPPAFTVNQGARRRAEDIAAFERDFNRDDDTPKNRAAWAGTAPAVRQEIEDRKMQGEWDRQEEEASTYNRRRNQQPEPPAQKTKAELRREQEIAAFEESYNAPGTVPESKGNVTDEEAARHERQVQKYREQQRNRSLVKAYNDQKKSDDELLNREDVPDEMKRNATLQAQEIVKSDPVYQHMAEAKKRGKLNLEAMGQDYDKETIGMINRRYPGIFSLLGTIKPDDFASEMGYENLDAMVRRFSEARTQKELTAQIAREKMDEWQRADAEQGEFFQKQAERQDVLGYLGKVDGYTEKKTGTVFPAPEEAVASMESMIKSRPDLFTDADLEHWTFTAEQQDRLKNTLRQTLSQNATNLVAQDNSDVPGPETSDNTEQTQQPETGVAQDATEKGGAVVDQAASDAALSPDNDITEPTDAQKEAGNYKKGHARIHGLDISIENPAGSVRSGTDPDGKRWETPIRDHYGYIKGTVGKDKDHIDIFVPEGFVPADGDMVAVVDQVDPKTGKFDEHKVVMGAADEQTARETYLRNYDETGKTRIGAITMMPVKAFKGWLSSGETRKPLGDIRGSQSARNEQQTDLPLTGETQRADQQPTSTKGEERQGQGRERLLEEELAATSDDDLTAMLDDVFGEKKEKSTAPNAPPKPRKTAKEQTHPATGKAGIGQSHPVPGRENANFVIHHSRAGYEQNQGKYRAQISPQDSRKLSTVGYGATEEAAYDQALARFDEAHQKPARQQKPKPTTTQPKTAGQITKEGGIAALDGVKSAMEGLSQLFGGKNRLGSGLAFDEETYAQAKPHFVKAWNDAKQAGYALKELIKHFHDQFGKAIRPYLERFLADVKSGNLTVEQESSTVNQGYTQQQSTEGDDNGTRADYEGTDRPDAAGSLRQDDTATEGTGDSALDAVSPEILQGPATTEQAADNGGEGGREGAGGNQGTDGNRLPTPRGGRGGSTKVHPSARGARNNKRDGRQGRLTDTPAVIPAKNFVITPDLQLGKGGEVAKFNDNLAAITTLKTIQREQRRATPDEQRILARYVGWGGLANAFKNPTTGEIKKGWEDKVQALESLLTPQELATARNSTQNAHYTSQDVVSAIWAGLQRLGFKGGIALEPSIGTGNFLGLMPQELAGQTNFVAAEYDNITAGIAKMLYPQEAVFHTPFEKLPLPANEFDLIIGNPPFGQTKLNFPHLPHLNRHTIHNQFFLAGIEALKPGGVQAFVVSRYLMDAKDPSVRRELAKRAKLLGAIRLPETAFKENARTEVVTDIIFLQKHPSDHNAVRFDSDGKEIKPPPYVDPAWVETVQIADEAGQEPITINSHFAMHPEMIVGTLGRTGSMHRDNDVGVSYEGNDFKGDLQKAINRALPAGEIQSTKSNNSQQLFEKMAESLHLSLTGAEDGSVLINDQGELVHVHERLSPSGEYMLTKRTLSPESPWSASLTQTHDGKWFEEVDKVNEKGEKVKRVVNGKTTNLNEKTKQYYDNDAAVPVSKRLGKVKYDRLRDAVGLLELVKEQIRLESITTSTDKEIEGNRNKLNRAYDVFVDKHGHTNSSTVAGVVSDVPNGALLLALEKSYSKPISRAASAKSGLPERPGSAEKASILSRRVIFPPVEITEADSANDALAINLSESGVVELERIASLLGKTEQEVVKELHDNADTPLIFFDPELQRWEKSDEYLGGNVVRKLNAAKEAGLDKNIAALEQIKPEPWGADKVTVLPGATWVPVSVYGDFVTHLTGSPGRVRFQKLTNTFYVTADDSATAASNWRTRSVSVAEIVDAMLNSKNIRVTYYDRESRSTVFDQEATDLANMKVAEVRDEFASWVFKDGERRRQLVEVFNQKYNVRVLKQRDGQHLKLPGKVPDTLIRMRRHQLNAIWRGIVDRFVLYDHAVGAGKTFTGIARAMERRRMGLSQKPMIVVPNHLVEQFAADVYRLYPNAKVLAAGKKDMEKKKRRRLFAKIATGDWDAVIVPHSSFAFIGIDQATETRYLEAELAVAEAAVLEAEEAAIEEGFTGPRKPLSVKQAEALRDRILKRLESLRDGGNTRDRLLTFEQLGVDDLTIDEAHEFKNLFYTSRLQARGMNPRAGSAKAYDLWTKVRVLRESHGSVAFMTGTPISNSAVEMYTMMRYLAADELAEMDIEHFDAWRSQFVDATTEFEPTESGRGLKEVLRLGRDWSNMRALMDMYYTFSDSVTNEDIQKWYKEDNEGKEFPIPRVKDGGRAGVNVTPTPLQKQMLDDIVAGFEGLPDIEDIDERNRTRLRLMDAARKVSIDVRAIDPTIKSDEKGGKLEVVSQRIAEIYNKWNSDKGTQLVFLDRSIPRARGDKKKLAEYDKKIEALREAERSGDEAAERRAQEALDKYDHNEMAEIRLAQESDWNAYDQIKKNLVAQGIPENEIRYIHEANTDEQKQELFDAVNSGTIRVFIGNTPRMGAGTNVQERLVALHHVDVTWKPSDIEQREGRIIRQGNKLLEKYGMDKFEVEILAYTTEYTIDAKLWSLNATKLKMINGIRQYNGEFNMEFDDNDSVSMAEIAAIASGDPLQLERVKLDAEIKKLSRQKAAFDRQRWGVQDAVDNAERIIETYPDIIKANEQLSGTITKAIDNESAEAEKRTITIDGKVFPYSSLKLLGQKNPYNYMMSKRDQAKESGEKFSVEVNGEITRSMDKAYEKVSVSLGDAPRKAGGWSAEATSFDLSIEGEHFYSRDGARRKIVDLANAAIEGKPDDMGETKIGTVIIHGLPFELSVETEATRDRGGEPVKAVTFYFEHEVPGKDGGKPYRISSFQNGSVLRINNKVNINSLDKLFEIVAKVQEIPRNLNDYRWRLEKTQEELPTLKEQANVTFPKAQELADKESRLNEVERELASRVPSNNTATPSGTQEPQALYNGRSQSYTTGTVSSEKTGVRYEIQHTGRRDVRPAKRTDDRTGRDPIPDTETGEPSAIYTSGTTSGIRRRRATSRFLSQVKHAAAGSFSYDGKPVISPREVAAIARPIADEAQENIVLVLTDENDMPVAVVRHSIGQIAAGTTERSTLLGVAHSIPEVKNIWIAHNHPSGNPWLSTTDHNMLNTYRNLAEDTGVEVRGMVAVTLSGEFSGLDTGGPSFGATAKQQPGGQRVKWLARKMGKQSSELPFAGEKDVEKWLADNKLAKEDGILLLANNHVPLGFLSISVDDMAQLRTGGKGTGASLVLGAIEESNAPRVIIVSGGQVYPSELDNAVRFFDAHGVLVIDTVISGSARSQVDVAALLGTDNRGNIIYGKTGSNTFFSKAQPVPAANRADIEGELRSSLGGVRSRRLLNSGKVVIVDSQKEMQGIIDGAENPAVKHSQGGAIQGAYVNGVSYLVRDGIAKGQAFPVLLHELGEHANQLGFSKDADYQSILKSLENRKDAKGATGDAIRAAMAKVPASTKPEHYWSEVAAYLIEQNANTELSIVDRIKAFFKKWLVKAGITSPDTLTHKDLVLFARAAINAASGGNAVQSAMLSVRDTFKPVDPNSLNLKRFLGNSQVTTPVYHGSPAEFWTFDKNRQGTNTNQQRSGLGFFFATDRAEAQGYAGPGGSNRSFYVKVENPRRMNASDLPKFRNAEEAQAYAKRQRLSGYDGIVLEDEGHVIVFEPNQVKSAEINTGAFDQSNPDVRYSRAQLADVIGDDRAAAIDAIANGGYSAAAERNYFKAMAKEGDDTVNVDDVALRTKAADWFKSLLPVVQRKTLGALTLRQLRDVFSGRLPQMEMFYQATRDQDVDAKKIMTKADEVYNKWAGLSKKAAKDMSELMIKATIGEVNPDAAQFEPRANSKALRQRIDANLTRIAEIKEELKGAGNVDKLTEEKVRLERSITKATEKIENEVRRFRAYKELAPMYRSLSKEAKAVYQDVKKLYTDNLESLYAALEERISRQVTDKKLRKETLDAIRLKYDRYLENGPYFPLSRFGEYLSVATKGGRREVRTFDTMAERTRYMRRRRRDGWEVQAKTKREFTRETAGASSGFVEGIFEILDETKGKIPGQQLEELKDQINQHFIKALPDLSHRKHFVHREKVEGYSRDQMRAFADNMQHAAHHIARIRHADKLETAVQSILQESRMMGKNQEGDEITDLYNELNARLKILNNPDISPVTQALTAGGFVMNIGPSIASALVNMSQTPLVAFPILATRFKQTGSISAMNAMMKATADYMGSKPRLESGPSLIDNKKLPQHERDMIQALIDDGTIDVTAAHSLAQAAGNDFFNMARTKHGHTAMRAMRLVSYPFHVAELANRKITALAAYRLALKNGFSQTDAIKEARESVLEGHFDYCVDQETECLTADGWKKYSELVPGKSKVFAVDDQGQMVTSKLVDLHVFNNGNHQVTEFSNSNGFSMVVTPNHTNLVQTYDSKKKAWGHIKKVKTADLRNHHYVVRTPHGFVPDGHEQEVYTDDEVRLIAWIAADGWYSKYRNCTEKNDVRIGQSETSKSGNPQELRELLARFGDTKEYTYDRTNKNCKDRFTTFVLPRNIGKIVKDAIPEKTLTFKFLRKLSHRQWALLLDLFLEIDGHQGKDGGRIIVQKNTINLECLQFIATAHGFSTSISQNGKYASLNVMSATKRSYVKEMTRKEAVVDMVWCPETAHGTWIARRNGRVFVTGNSQANRARWMEGNVRRVLLLFKQYSQQMTWLLGRSFYQAAKGESKEVKAMAKKRLGMILGGHFLLAGLQGMPVLGGVMAVVQFLFSAFGDDDDPKDLEVSLRNLLADTVGKEAGEAIASGPWRMLPVLGDLDLSSRVSLGDLWFRAPERETEGRDKWNQYVNLLLGPVATNASNIFLGAGTMADGQVWRGMEMMLPKFIKDSMKSVRYAQEGVKNWNEDTLIDNLSAMELFGQALGFTPANISEMYEGANAIKNHERRINNRRQLLINRWVQETRRGDAEAAREAMDNITAFNQKQPLFGVTGDTLRRSYQGRIKAQAQTKGGAYLPATKEELRNIGRFANI